MSPRGESYQGPDVENAMDVQDTMEDVRKMQEERVSGEQSVSAETLQALSGVFAVERGREAVERASSDAVSLEASEKSLAQMDALVDDVESRNRELTEAEKEEKELGLRIKLAAGMHELAESINAAEQLVFESVLETQQVPAEFEQIALKMRMDVSRDALRSYAALAEQVFQMNIAGKHLPEGHRKQLMDHAKRLQGLIRHEHKIASLAEKNFVDNMDAKLAKFERGAAERKAA